jgi:RNA polymerase sigma-70 factor (ECF subfamily)
MVVMLPGSKPNHAPEKDKNNAEERQLVARAKDDAEAFGQLYQRYVRRIYNYHYQFTHNREEAEDLTSRTFFQALRGMSAYHDRGLPFQAWLFRIAHNLMVNWYREQSRHPVIGLEQVVDEVYAEEGNPQADAAQRAERERLRQLLNGLSEDRRTLLILKFVEKMPNAEIAKVLGRSEGAVKVLYHRTLLGLREKAGSDWQGGEDVFIA